MWIYILTSEYLFIKGVLTIRGGYSIIYSHKNIYKIKKLTFKYIFWGI